MRNPFYQNLDFEQLTTLRRNVLKNKNPEEVQQLVGSAEEIKHILETFKSAPHHPENARRLIQAPAFVTGYKDKSGMPARGTIVDVKEVDDEIRIQVVIVAANGMEQAIWCFPSEITIARDPSWAKLTF